MIIEIEEITIDTYSINFKLITRVTDIQQKTDLGTQQNYELQIIKFFHHSLSSEEVDVNKKKKIYGS